MYLNANSKMPNIIHRRGAACCAHKHNETTIQTHVRLLNHNKTAIQTHILSL
jgi:hypothetical protein